MSQSGVWQLERVPGKRGRPVSLPVEGFQCPEQDGNFTACSDLLELCAVLTGWNCEACQNRDRCLACFNALTEKCSDKRLSDAETISFLRQFVAMWKVKIEGG